jgi:predicted Zn-dependent peptidase
LSAVENHLLQNKKCKIFSISVAKKKKNVYKAYIQVRNDEGDFFSIEIEDAIKNEEVSFGFSEDEVLELLKKEKEKMEFGLITKDEFEKRKKEILKRKNSYK